jgi:protein gp37
VPTESVINKNRYMKKVGTKDIENLIEAKVNKLKGRAKSHKIAWTEKTWNPSAGCTKISSGCKNCYAEKMAIRLQAIGMVGYENGFEFNPVPSRLNDPLKRKKATVYFVNSMSDIFHEDMPEEYLNKIFNVIELTPQHTYQILTKRADRMFQYLSHKAIPKNIWLGVTVDNRKEGLPRIDKLRNLQASVLFLSVEPLLEDLGKMNLKNIDWVIVGGESGNKARPMDKEWVVNIKQQCETEGIAFFFKQWGTWSADKIKRNKKLNGKELDGKIWQQYPEIIEQQFAVI